MYTKLKNSQKTRKALARTSRYIKNRTNDRHKDIGVSEEEYLGPANSEASFNHECLARLRKYRKQRRFARGRKSRALSQWDIERAPDNTRFSKGQLSSLITVAEGILGPGACAEITFHVPTEKKRRPSGVPGPELNVLFANHLQFGSFIIPVRIPGRNLRREFMRAYDLYQRKLNRVIAAPIEDMGSVLARKRNEPLLSEVLAALEERRWREARAANYGKARSKPEPIFGVLASTSTLTAALEDEEYLFLRSKGTETEPVDETVLGLELANQVADDFVYVTHWRWEERRKEQAAKRNRKRERKYYEQEPRCRIDLLRILMEARVLWRERLRELEQQLSAEQEGQQKTISITLVDARDESRTKTPPAFTQRWHGLKPPLIPAQITMRAEQRMNLPLLHQEDAPVAFFQLGFPVRKDDPAANTLTLQGAGALIEVPRDEALVGLQLAAARRLFGEAGYYFTDGQGDDCLISSKSGCPLDPFAPVWTKYHDNFSTFYRQESWRSAFDHVEGLAKDNPAMTPLEKAAQFYCYLVKHESIGPAESLFMTSLHFRSSTRSCSQFLRSLGRRVRELGAAFVDPPRLRSPADEKRIEPLPATPPAVPGIGLGRPQPQPPAWSPIAPDPASILAALTKNSGDLGSHTEQIGATSPAAQKQSPAHRPKQAPGLSPEPGVKDFPNAVARPGQTPRVMEAPDFNESPPPIPPWAINEKPRQAKPTRKPPRKPKGTEEQARSKDLSDQKPLEH